MRKDSPARKLLVARGGQPRLVTRSGGLLTSAAVIALGACLRRGKGDTYAVQTLGKARGALRIGQYLTFPSKARSTADVWVTFANALDLPIKSLGLSEHNRGPLPGVLS